MSRQSCLSAIKSGSPFLDCNELGLDPERVLAAIAYCESNLGANSKERFEPAYAQGGHYYKVSQMVRDLFSTFGSGAACSWSSFQIMFIVARELGYRGTPMSLADDAIAVKYVVRLLNRRIIRGGAGSLEDIADAYNSGSFKDGNKPQEYIDKFCAAYHGTQVANFLEEDF